VGFEPTTRGFKSTLGAFPCTTSAAGDTRNDHRLAELRTRRPNPDRRAGPAKDCAGLQTEFDTAAANDDAQRARVGEGNAELMAYIDEWLTLAGCYD
jgi:hypothetical protein